MERRAAGLLSNKLMILRTLAVTPAWRAAKPALPHVVLILAAALVEALAVTLAWRAAKPALPHVVLILAAALVEVLVIILAVAPVITPAC